MSNPITSRDSHKGSFRRSADESLIANTKPMAHVAIDMLVLADLAWARRIKMRPAEGSFSSAIFCASVNVVAHGPNPTRTQEPG
jgi:hypothetical protein